jgi:hypothetical protein
MLGTAAAFAADIEGKEIPFISPAPVEIIPASVEAIGAAAPPELPETDYKTWFAGDVADGATRADPYAPAKWEPIAAFAAEAGTGAGWTEACKAAGAAAGSDRAAEPLLGALGCSDDPAVTLVQRFALRILHAQALLALWIRGVPGANESAIVALQGEIQLMCSIDVIAREGGTGSAYAEACVLAMDAAYRTGDGPATFEALRAAYELVAGEIAARDPTIDPEPGFYETAASAPAP